MSKLPRREFLKKTAASVAGASAFAQLGAAGAEQPADSAQAIPPHTPMLIPGVHAYAEESVLAGETIHFRAISTVPCDLSVVRLGLGVDDFSSDEVVHSFPRLEPKQQAIHPGSYIHVEKGLPPEKPLSALTLECWVRPWSWEVDQALITAFDPQRDCGFALYLMKGGWVKFYLGDGARFTGNWQRAYKRNEIRRWQHLVLTWEHDTARFYGNGKFQASWKIAGPLRAGRTPLRLGAAGNGGLASDFLDGDLAMPAIYERALTAEEVKKRFAADALLPPKREGLVACWPLAEESGDRVEDLSGNEHHGQIINRATWMIGGPSFDADSVSRFGDYDPARDPKRGHGLRFASDDLYDCRWETTHEYGIPENAKSGLYVGRFQFDLDGERRKYHVTFIVRKARNSRKAPILMLCSTNTWRAYSATPFAKNVPDNQFWYTQGLANATGHAPSYSCYRNHRHGQPSYGFGRSMPWPAAGPDALFSTRDVNYSHLMRGERFTHVWLDNNGFDYDVAADYDLHRDPSQLDDYKVLVINGHSEYWSIEAYEGVDRFLRNGGSVVVLSGNTMFWRVSYDDDGGVMECRKYDTDIGGREGASPGEVYHSHDKKRGSLMRYAGYPAWKVLGLECIGWWPITDEKFGAYEAVNPDHFLFRGPEQVGVRKGERFGQSPDGSLPRVGGHESDVRIGRIRAITKHIPEGETVPEEPRGISTLAQITAENRRGIDYFGRWEPLDHGVYAEMTYWERPQGGQVFHGGCIAGGWALSADDKFSALMRNVLHHFGVEREAG